MKRFLIFGFEGPAATYLIFCASFGWPPRPNDILLAYKMTVPPFLLCAGVDRYLVDRVRWWERPIIMAVIGFVAFALAALIGDRGDPTYIWLGVLAIIPAALCSLLSMAVADERPSST
jgi:peptidoglycan/LPS O-acetylase OafA/YrhL